MKKILAALALVSLTASYAQISVYDCENPAEITAKQDIIDETDGVFNRNCINMEYTDQGYDFTGGINRSVQAYQHIKITPEFKAGNFNAQGGLQLKIAKSNFDVVYFDYDNLDEVLRYEKLELGIEVPQELGEKIQKFILNENDPDGVNPFLEWELKVQAVFTHESGLQKKIDGFFYREFEYNSDQTDWVDVGTQHAFRVRFAPPKNGKWTCELALYDGGIDDPDITYEADPFLFNVVESGNPGYFKVASNLKNFQLGDDIKMPVGVNLPWPIVRAQVEWGTEMPTPVPYQYYLQSLDEYANIGGRYIRHITTPMSTDIEYEKVGNYYDRMHMAWENDKIFDKLRDNNQYINWTLMMHNQIRVTAGYHLFQWDFTKIEGEGAVREPWAYKAKFNAEKPSDLFNNEEALAYMKQRLRYMLSRWGYSTQIVTMEMVSESNHLDEVKHFKPGGQDNLDSVYAHYVPWKYDTLVMKSNYNFHKEMTEYIKLDMKHTEHLLGVDYTGFKILGDRQAEEPENPTGEHNYEFGNIVAWDRSCYLPTIDVIGINFYSAHATKDWNIGESLTEMRNRFAKPIYCPEGSVADGIESCDSLTTVKIDAMMWGNLGWASYNVWTGSNYPVPPYKTPQYDRHGPVVWNHFVNANNFYNNRWKVNHEVLPTNWTHHMGNRKKSGTELWTVGTHNITSTNRKNAFGIVYNRTYNHFTQRIDSLDAVPDSVFNDDGTLKRVDTLNSSCFTKEASDKDDAALSFAGDSYIYNRDHYLHYEENFNAGHLGRKVYAYNLIPHRKYVVEFYDHEGNLTDYYNIRRADAQGRLRIRHPALRIKNGILEPFYTFDISRGNGKSGEIDDYSTEESREDVKEILEEKGITIIEDFEMYPNPSSGDLKLFVNALDETVNVYIYNVHGAQVYHKVLNNGENSLSLNLEKGVYLVKMVTMENVSQQNLIIN